MLHTTSQPDTTQLLSHSPTSYATRSKRTSYTTVTSHLASFITEVTSDNDQHSSQQKGNFLDEKFFVLNMSLFI